MNLSEINSCCLLEGTDKPAVKLYELEVGLKNPIVSAKKTNSKYGTSILVELPTSVVFLPKRATKSLEDHLEELGSGKYFLVFRGQKDVGQPNLVSLFEIVE